MEGKYHQVAEELREPAKALRQQIPDVLKGYGEMHAAVMNDGAISKKTKELIAIALAVAERCDGCITSHTRSAALLGLTKEEIAEAIGVAILLSGGPGTVYGPRAYESFLEFEESNKQRR